MLYIIPYIICKLLIRTSHGSDTLFAALEDPPVKHVTFVKIKAELPTIN